MVIANSAHAELLWESTEVSDELGVDRVSLVATYRFKNIGPRPVRIAEVKSGCGCANGSTDRTIYEPGDSGTLSVTFEGLGAIGPQQRTLTIVTDEPKHSPYTLSLRVNIKEWFSVTPRLLVWAINEPPTPKTISAKIAVESGATVTSVTSSTPGVGARIVPASATNEITLVEIDPGSTQTALRATVKITAKRKGSPDVVKTVFVRVQ